jgi:hypothetical protein
VQRVIEQVATSALLQEAAQVEFVIRLLGSDRFYRVDPALLQAIRYRRLATLPRLRRLFADAMRLAGVGGLMAEARYFHLPYIAIGATRLERLVFPATEWPAGERALQPVAPPSAADTLFNPGDLWWQRHYAASLAGLKERTGVRIVQMIHDLYVLERPDWSPGGFSKVFARQFQGIAPRRSLAHQFGARQGPARGLPGVVVAGARPITVLPMGWDSFGRGRALAPVGVRAVLDRHGIGRHPFVLFVGTIEPRKNVSALLDAMEACVGSWAPVRRLWSLSAAMGGGARAERARLRRGHREGHLFWVTNGERRSFGTF